MDTREPPQTRATIGFSVCRFKINRTLLITALGAQPSELPSERFPLIFFVYINSPNTWQIGRLIDRIHYLGTVRLAAIVDLEKLHRAGIRLRALEESVEEALDAVHGVSESNIANVSATGNPAKAEDQIDEGEIDEEEEESSRSQVYQIKDRFARLQKQKREINRELEGDIEYRIERSRYYVKQFRKNVRGLRNQRLEGYQPYPIFVERRMGSAFDFIDMLGIRYERVKSDMSSLFQYYLTQNAASVEIGLKRRNGEIRRLQQGAELAAFGALIPYYLGSTLEHFAESRGWIKYAWAILWIAGISEASRRAYKYYPRIRFVQILKGKFQEIQRAGWVVTIAVAAALLLLLIGLLLINDS